MGGLFINLLTDAIVNSNKALYELNILSDFERKQILEDFNNTDAEYPKGNTIHELFEEQVKKHGENIAVEFCEERLSYKDLNDKANALAFKLREEGAGPDSFVSIMAKRSLELIVGILGILKAGGAYLPVNPNYPATRINQKLSDSRTKVLIINGDKKDDVIFNGSVINLKDDRALKVMNIDTINNINKSNDLAYVIYTSGSTGQPKGAMIEHKSIINFLYSMYNAYNADFSEKDRCLSLTNISFDVSVCEIFMPLVFGATLILFEPSDILDIVKISEILVKKLITFAYIPPSLLADIVQLLNEKSGSLCLEKL